MKEVPKYAPGETRDYVLRSAVTDMLRKERDRLEELAATYRRSGGDMGHQMSIRANAFDHAAWMVEAMP